MNNNKYYRSVYRCYFDVNVINEVFKYHLVQWKLHKCKIICNIPQPSDLQGGRGVDAIPLNKVLPNFEKTICSMGLNLSVAVY